MISKRRRKLSRLLWERDGSTIGSIAGTYFGPLGSMIGGWLGGKIGGLFRNRTYKRPGAPVPADDIPSPFFDEGEHAASLPDDEEAF